MAAFGLQAQLEEDSNQEIWSENWPIVRVFMRMQSQWAAGPNGVIGLRYESLPMIFEIESIAPDNRSEVMDGIQIMESAALAALKTLKT